MDYDRGRDCAINDENLTSLFWRSSVDPTREILGTAGVSYAY